MSSLPVVENRTFERSDILKPFQKAEYDCCTFKSCDLSEAVLSGSRFFNCKFDSCNLTTSKISETSFADTEFKGCKMLGLRFDQCNKFSMAFIFKECALDHSSFQGLDLKKMKFLNCTVRECDFTASNLSSAVFDECDLSRTTFDQTNLEKADLRTATNYSIDPRNNKVLKAKFSMPEAKGLLDGFGVIIE
jgi:fluoroquinolone resistance protein